MNKFAAFLIAFTFAAADAAGASSATLSVSNMDCAVCPITVRKAM